MADGFGDKLASFQAITGLEDPDLCTEILSALNWDLELAIASFTSNAPLLLLSSAPGLAWRNATLPFYVVSGDVGLGFCIAGGVTYRTIGLLDAPRGAEGGRLIPVLASTAEAADFVDAFERDYPADPRCAGLLPANPVLVPTGGLSN